MGNLLIIVNNTIVGEALRHLLFPEYQATTLDYCSAQQELRGFTL